MQTTAVGLR